MVCGSRSSLRVCGNRSRMPLTLGAPQPSSSHPHSETPHPEHSSRLTANPDVLSIWNFCTPATSVAPENCTHTESFAHEFATALSRIQSLYVWVGSAKKRSAT